MLKIFSWFVLLHIIVNNSSLSTDKSYLIDIFKKQKIGCCKLFGLGMVGAVVRSLLSDHKVPSAIPALPRFEYLWDLRFHLS